MLLLTPIIHVALSKRAGLSLSFGSTTVIVVLRDVEATVNEHRLSKRDAQLSFRLTLGPIAIKRGIEEAELSKRSEVYNLVVPSLPPANNLSGRSTDAYAGRPVEVCPCMSLPVLLFEMLTLRTCASIADAMIQGLQEIGVTQDMMPEYFSQNLHATDPETGNTYQLVPANGPLAIDIGKALAREL